MSFRSQSHILIMLVVAGCLVAGSVGTASADELVSPELTLRISDTTAFPGDTNAWISVYVRNFQDVLSGFSLMILLDRQDLIEFRTETEDTLVDTTWQYCGEWDGDVCINWVDTMIIDTVITSGAIDTIGSAMSGWELVSARSPAGSRYNIKVTALADKLGGGVTEGIDPSNNEKLLCKLKTRIYEEITDSSNTLVGFNIVDNLNETSFSDPGGNLIGTRSGTSICDTSYYRCDEYDPVEDTCIDWVAATETTADTMVVDTFFHYWFCTDWDGDSCTSWIDTTEADADSIWIEGIPWTERDTLVSFYADGSLEVIIGAPCICGDANGDEVVNVGDAVYIVNYIFKGGAAPVNPMCSDGNNDGSTNVGDAVLIVNYIFKNGAAPYCGF